MICVYFTNMPHHILALMWFAALGDSTTNLKLSAPDYIMHKLVPPSISSYQQIFQSFPQSNLNIWSVYESFWKKAFKSVYRRPKAPIASKSSRKLSYQSYVSIILDMPSWHCQPQAQCIKQGLLTFRCYFVFVALSKVVSSVLILLLVTTLSYFLLEKFLLLILIHYKMILHCSPCLLQVVQDYKRFVSRNRYIWKY